MLTKLITQLNTAIARYKAKRVAAVVDAYADLIGKTVSITIPGVVGFYQHGAKVVVAKTYENPQVALDLLKALQAAVDHYGPELTKAFETTKDLINAAQPDSSSLEAAVEAMLADTEAA